MDSRTIVLSEVCLIVKYVSGVGSEEVVATFVIVEEVFGIR